MFDWKDKLVISALAMIIALLAVTTGLGAIALVFEGDWLAAAILGFMFLPCAMLCVVIWSEAYKAIWDGSQSG